MSNSESADVETVVRLLSDQSPSTVHARYADCEAIVTRYLHSGSDFLLRLIKAVIAADAHKITLIQDAVSFLGDEHLGQLAFFLQAQVKRGIDVEDLLVHVTLQTPDLFPASTLVDNPDFKDWLTHADPQSPPACQHFIFEEGAPSDMSFPTHRNHPTWHLPAHRPSFVVGGVGKAVCPTCGRRLTHLVTLDGVEGLPRLRLETCQGSLEPTYYSHDADGMPTPIAPFHSSEDFMSRLVSGEHVARLAPTPQRWLRQSWFASNSRQNLFRLGGLPSWVQGPDFPLVPGTDRKMEFLLQFDSFAGFFWGSGGMLYVFWDEESRITCHVSQWT
ncbi:hypothetical protein CK218_04010 [Mesorhizobium sp. WSM3879]|uniref:hypothetical protein n=1 Tax=Mesorhizobium sp. WSM3879 TaxID=2029406 RepID=UPI000BB0B85D|nr:hypothetical protein [Mesorhizobium sp. WSM3879]PBB82057.1 hypothetical protein CK218_04010 [Mesorhizobium sp. WSM3879]